MPAPAVVPWIQYNEDVVGEAEPNGVIDVSNRPLKFIMTQSSVALTATFPGFMVLYQGSANPEGVQTANIGHAFVDTTGQVFYLKMTGVGNTGWIAIGGNPFGNGSPEGVVTAPIGKLYEQRDAASAANAVWIKATGTGNTGWRQNTGFVKLTDNAIVLTGTTATFTATVTDSITIGNGNTIAAINTIAIGTGASVSAADGISVGRAATVAALAVGGIVFGQGSTVAAGATTGGIVIGTASTSAAQGQIVIGRAITGLAAGIGNIYIGDGITVTGGGGPNVVAIGKGISTGTGTNTIIGANASVVGGTGVCIGQASSILVGGSSGSVAIAGNITTAGGQNSIAIIGTCTGGNQNVCIGSAANCSNDNTIAIGGHSSTGPIASGAGGIAIAAFSQATASESLAIGFASRSTHAASISLGRAQSIQANEFTVGGSNGLISQFRFNVDSSGTPQALTFRISDASGSNIAGANWTHIASRNTGSGAAGQHIFQVGAVNGTATSLGAATTTFIVDRTVAVGSAVATETALTVTIGTTVTGGVGRIINAAATVTAAANNDVMVGIRSALTVSIAAFTGTVAVGLDIATVSGAATNLAFRSATGRALLGTATVNTGNTSGLTISQAGADDEILTLKSSDVAHGVTTVTETDTYGYFRKRVANGGLAIVGLNADGTDKSGISFSGIVTVTDTVKSNAARAAFGLDGQLKSGTGTTSLGANANIAYFADNGTTRFILDADGDSHQDVGTSWTNFDTHDDVALLNRLSAHVTRRDDPLRDSFGRWLSESKADLEQLKLVTFNEDGHHFVNMSRLTMLHTGAIRQLAQRFERIEAVLKLLPA